MMLALSPAERTLLFAATQTGVARSPNTYSRWGALVLAVACWSLPPKRTEILLG